MCEDSNGISVFTIGCKIEKLRHFFKGPGEVKYIDLELLTFQPPLPDLCPGGRLLVLWLSSNHSHRHSHLERGSGSTPWSRDKGAEFVSVATT